MKVGDILFGNNKCILFDSAIILVNMKPSTNYSKPDIEIYANSLARIGALSNLFSESVTPFIHYRATEYLYSRSMNADNLSRSDIAIDAKLGKIGVGIKTFVYNNKPKYEKIAEFNKEVETFDQLEPLEKIIRVAGLRNDRIDFAGRLAGVDTFIYHCIARLPGKVIVFEQEMPRININAIEVTLIKGRNISFKDGKNNYRFNSSKSTLFKEFFNDNTIFEKSIIIYEDPFTFLNTLDLNETATIVGMATPKSSNNIDDNYVILPLYGRDGQVFERSGLNQWNARGRIRDLNEVYIPNPVEAQRKRPNFFPPRDTPFTLHFPDGNQMTVKICQEGNKALMSSRNAELGEWLLRDVLQLKEGTLVTRELLDRIGIDAIKITKQNGRYSIDFKHLGAYEEFLEN
jgi:hypothetical protein